ncbi:hypothetical protein NQ317_015381 [Molorchus minor]|uniref:Uncharacterized protein n=1 Tax=Molorchus minor TaxID=1323400 RepID=A0ABQ9J3M2_9CUCU|nr:hypothetical protein NQ317_015381 [Molorchus minor]
MGVLMNNKSRSPVNKGTICQIFAAVTGNLIAISDGMTVGWTGPMIPYLLSEKKPSSNYEIPSKMVGNVVITRFYSRKKSLLFASFVLLLAWIIIPLSGRIEYIYISRFF